MALERHPTEVGCNTNECNPMLSAAGPLGEHPGESVVQSRGDLPPMRPSRAPPVADDQNTEGGGVWAEHLRWATPESVAVENRVL